MLKSGEEDLQASEWTAQWTAQWTMVPATRGDIDVSQTRGPGQRSVSSIYPS